MFGKWHVGDFDTNPAWNPTKHGFDLFLGLPYSHDYNPQPGVPLYHNLEKVEQPVKYNLLTQRYTQEAISFIKAPKTAVLHLPRAQHAACPVGTSDAFKGHPAPDATGTSSRRSTGAWARSCGPSSSQHRPEYVVVFQSDNGPWVSTPSSLRSE